MPKALDRTVVNESSSDDDTGGAVSSAEKEDEGRRGPNPVDGVGAHPHKECTVLGPPVP